MVRSWLKATSPGRDSLGLNDLLLVNQLWSAYFDGLNDATRLSVVDNDARVVSRVVVLQFNSAMFLLLIIVLGLEIDQNIPSIANFWQANSLSGGL